MKSISVNYIVKDGELQPETTADMAKIKLFRSTLPEGTRVEMFISRLVDNDKTTAQLAKVHAYIRELAEHSGHSMQEMKDVIKLKAGLIEIDGSGLKVLKSFAECSRTELSVAIEVCNEYADLLGIPVS